MPRISAAVASLIVCCTLPVAISATDPLRVCLVSGTEEYDSATSLSAFKQHLEANYNAACTLIQAEGKDNLPGLEALEDCDVALFFTRRRTIDGEQLERVKKYCLGGNPIVAVRTASHGFQNWLEFDKLVLGGSYDGHYKNNMPMKATIAPGAESHPILAGVEVLDSTSSLYRNYPLAEDAQMLVAGTTAEGTHPIAWTRVHNGGRVFYTSLGSPLDFQNESFRRMAANALFWTATRDVERLDAER